MSQNQMFWILVATQLMAKCTHAGSLVPPTYTETTGRSPMEPLYTSFSSQAAIVLPYIPFQSFNILFTVVSLVIIIW